MLQAAGLIFILALLPVLGFSTFQFQQFSLTADHYLYVALLGPAIAIASASIAGRPGIHIGEGVIVLLLAGQSFAQARYWHDDFVLFPHVFRVNPDSFLARNNLGTAYDAHGVLENSVNPEADWQAALNEFAEAIHIKPDYIEAYENYAADIAPPGPSRCVGESAGQSVGRRRSPSPHVSPGRLFQAAA